MRHGFAVCLALGLCACAREPRWYAVPPQQTAFYEPPPPEFFRLSEWPEHNIAVSGVTRNGDPSTWFWTEEKVVLRIPVMTSQPRRLRVAYTVPGSLLERSGTALIAFFCNGQAIGKVQHTAIGEQQLLWPVPGNLLQPGTALTVSFTVEPATPVENGRFYGVLIRGAGLEKL